MFVVVTEIPLDPDSRQTALDVVRPLVAASEAEDGTVRYHATTSVTERNRLLFVEEYEDADAAAAHTESDAYRAFVETLPSVVDGDIETTQIRTAEHERVAFSAAEAVAALQ